MAISRIGRGTPSAFATLNPRGGFAPTIPEVRLIVLLLASALVATPVSTTSFPSELSAELNDVVQRYVAATQMQRNAMLGGQIEMDIEGRFTKLREQGRMRVLRTITLAGEMPSKMLEFTGDNRIKTELIARYLEAEEKTKAYGAMTIAPKDYEFNIKAILKRNGQSVYVFEVSPRKNDADRFRGELWVDGATGMPLREAGRLVKSPHLLLTNLRFARDYELHDGVSIVKHFQSSTDIRLLGVGSAELDVSFSNFSRVSAEQPAREERL